MEHGFFFSLLCCSFFYSVALISSPEGNEVRPPLVFPLLYIYIYINNTWRLLIEDGKGLMWASRLKYKDSKEKNPIQFNILVIDHPYHTEVFLLNSIFLLIQGPLEFHFSFILINKNEKLGLLVIFFFFLEKRKNK